MRLSRASTVSLALDYMQTKYNKLAEKPWFFNPKSIQFTKMTKGDTLRKQYISLLFAVMPKCDSPLLFTYDISSLQ